MKQANEQTNKQTNEKQANKQTNKQYKQKSTDNNFKDKQWILNDIDSSECKRMKQRTSILKL